MKLTITSLGAGALAIISAVAFSSCRGGGDEGTTSINIAGSDTMLQVGLAWQEGYKSVKKDVTLAVDGQGSSTGFKALIDDKAQIAHSSRAIKSSEAEDIKAKYGKDAVEHIVGYDGIAVYVHPDNPVKSLTMAQLKEIWAEGGSVENWNQVGGSDATIERMGRANNSGTYGFFQEHVLGKGTEFKPGTGAAAGSTAVVEFCATTPAAIGYSGMSYKTDAVGWLSVSAAEGEPAIEPSIANVQDKSYPIARPLYIYTVGEPEGAVKEYLDWIKGPDGQKILAEQGFVPIK
ncbi:MAG: phosphate ABC transporter substrate-binding protein [Verrucomicrobiales bacterium]